tara:strand:+ start:3461 stop:5113 length:1653 start_codon:yes stop_codon:yes gene_type:complete
MHKLITYVTAIANDGYYKDLVYRIQKTIDLNLFFLNKIKDKYKIEIIIVDWGSKKKFSDLIYVNSKFKKQVKFVYVSEKLTKKHSRNYKNNFNLDTSFNVGIRRAKGKFIIVGGCDQFFDLSSWRNLINFAKENKGNKNIFLVPRKILDYDLYKSNFNNEYYLKSLNHFNSTNFKFKAHTFYTGGGFATMLTKSNYTFFRGLNEKMKPGTSNDSESVLRSNLYGLNKVNTDKFGIHLIKFPPIENSLRNKIVYSKGFRAQPTPTKKINVNNLNWGLKNENLKISYSKNTSKGFENSNKFLSKNFFEYKKNKLSIYNTLLNSSQFHLKNFFYLRKIFLTINLIDFLKVSKFSEYGFNNSSTLDIIGNRFKYLDIIIFDNNKKNYSNTYYKRVGSIIDTFNESRYGLFHSIISDKDQIFFDYLKNNYLKGERSLLLIKPGNLNSLKKIFKTLNKNNYNKLFNYVLIFQSQKFYNKDFLNNLKRKYYIYQINQNNFFLKKKDFKNNNIDEKRINKILTISSVEFILPYFIFLCHRTFSKIFKFMRALAYSLLR